MSRDIGSFTRISNKPVPWDDFSCMSYVLLLLLVVAAAPASWAQSTGRFEQYEVPVGFGSTGTGLATYGTLVATGNLIYNCPAVGAEGYNCTFVQQIDTQDFFSTLVSDVTIYGGFVAVGVAYETVNGTSAAGAVYLFECGDANCSFVGNLTAPNFAYEDQFGAVIELSDSLLVVAAPNKDAADGSNTGVVFVYAYTTSTGLFNCTLGSQLYLNDTYTSADFGGALAVFETTVVVGAYNDYSVSIYSCTISAVCTLGIYYKQSSGQFGFQVAAYGTVVAAATYTTNLVLVFSCPTVFTCSRGANLTAPVLPNGVAATQYGHALALFNTTLVVGAPTTTVNNFANQGVAFVYLCLTPDVCTLGSMLTASDGIASNEFGNIVAVYGTVIVVNSANVVTDGASIFIFTLESESNNQAVCLDGNFTGLDCNTCPLAEPYIGASACVAQCPDGMFLDPFLGLCTACLPACTVCNDGSSANCSACATSYKLIGSSCMEDFLGTEIISPDGLQNDAFGSAVAIATSGLVAIGTKNRNGSTGAVYIYDCASDGSSCTFGAELVPSTPYVGGKFGSSVAFAGDVLAVGAPSANSSQGVVYVFVCTTATTCSSSSILTAPVSASSFGSTLASYSDVLVVGMSGGIDAFVYLCTTSACTLASTLTPDSSIDGSSFGAAVAVYDQLVAVGSPDVTVNGNSNQGAVYLFSCPTYSTCAFGQNITATDGGSGYYFGQSVAISGQMVFIGSPSWPSSGIVYAFVCSDATSCTGPNEFKPSMSGSGIGTALSISGSILVVTGASTTAATFFCAPVASNVSCVQGSIFGPNNGLAPSNVGFGGAVAINETLIVITGSGAAIGNHESQGAVFTFSVLDVTTANVSCVPGNDGASCSACAPGYSGSGCSICASGYYSGGIDCLTCGFGCASCVGNATNCQSCSGGYYLSGSSCIHTPTASATASYTQSATASATQSESMSRTASCTQTATASNSQSATASATQSATYSATASFTPSASASFTESFTHTPSPTASFTESQTASFTESFSHTPSPTASYTQSFTSTPSSTPTPVACANVTAGNATWPLAALGTTVQGACLPGFAGQPSRYCAFSGVFGPVSSPCLPIVPVPSSAVSATLVVSDNGATLLIALTTTIAPAFVLVKGVQIAWTTTASINISSPLASLTIAKTQLVPGTYTFAVTVTATSATSTQTANATASITIAELPPVVVLTPNVASFAAAFDQPLALNASASYDPNAGATGVSCAWSSAVILFNTTSCVQTIPANTLATGSSYVFNVTVTSLQYGTNSSTSVVVAAQGSVSAVVSVAVQGVSASGVIGLQSYTRLAGSFSLASGYTATAQTAVAYTWSCAVVSGAAACPDLTDFKDTVASAPNSNNLVLFPHVLTAGAQYSFRLTVATTSPPGSGFGEVSVTANQLPADGSFAVTPLQGVQFQDVFTLLVGGWVDPEGGSLQYNYIAQSSIGLSSLLSQPGSQDSTFTSSLPLGQIQLWATVVDDTGDYVLTIQIAVNVTSNVTSVAEVQQVAAQELQQATQAQDSNTILQIVNAVAQLLANKGSSDPTLAAQVRYNLTAAVQVAANLQSLSSSNVATLVQALDAVASNPGQLSDNSLNLILLLMTELASLAGSTAQQFLSVITSIDIYLSSTGSSTANQTTTIQANVADVITSLLADALCDEQAQSVSTSTLQVTGQKSSTLGGSSFQGGNSSAASFGNGFDPAGAGACAEIHLIGSSLNPFAYVNTSLNLPANATALNVSATTLTLNFYDADTNAALTIADLPSSGLITLTFSPVADALNASVRCVFFNETLGAWDTAGCTKSEATTGDTLVCVCSHATTFTIGTLTLDINALVIPTVINAKSVGLVASTVAVAGLILLYIVFAVFAIYKDRESAKTAEAPSDAELAAFGERVLELWGRRAPNFVLSTMHLGAWKDAYGVDMYPKGTRLSFFQRMYVAGRAGFKYNHAYFLLFFQPMTPGTRLARISTTVASVFVTLVVSATFFQDTASSRMVTMSEIEQKVFAGMVSSIVVFVPFSLLGFLMRRVKHDHQVRDPQGDAFELLEKEGKGIHSELFEPRHWSDVLVPKWVEIVLYILLLVGALVSSIMAIFYGVQFEDTEAANWIESFFISWAASAIFLQSVQAIIGSVFTTVIGAISTLAAGLALLITNSAIN